MVRQRQGQPESTASPYRAREPFDCNTGNVELAPGVTIDEEVLETFCRVNGVRRLGLFARRFAANFASISTSTFSWSSSRTEPPGLLHLAALELKLTELVGREVDLRTAADLSRHFRGKISASARCMTPPDDHIRLAHLREAGQVSEPTRLAHPSVPWSAAARMRDRLGRVTAEDDAFWASPEGELITAEREAEVSSDRATAASPGCDCTANFDKLFRPRTRGGRSRVRRGWIEMRGSAPDASGIPAPISRWRWRPAARSSVTAARPWKNSPARRAHPGRRCG